MRQFISFSVEFLRPPQNNNIVVCVLKGDHIPPSLYYNKTTTAVVLYIHTNIAGVLLWPCVACQPRDGLASFVATGDAFMNGKQNTPSLYWNANIVAGAVMYPF